VTKKVYAPGLIALLSAICLTSIASAQTSWWRTYGGSGDDVGNSVQQTTDGGYIIAGYTSFLGAGGQDVYVIKTDASGDTLWTKTYGGTRNDEGNSVQQTTDGGYVIVGWTISLGAGLADVYLVKTDSLGDTLWTRTYGGTSYDEGFSVQQTTDGGYIITGCTYSFGAGRYDIYLVKTNAQGDTLWTRTYGGTGIDWGYSVQQTTDGGYTITGITTSFGAGGNDVYLIKTNAQGGILWTRTFGGTDDDEGYSVQQTTDGGYIITGCTSSFGAGRLDIYLVKTNAQGDTLWTRTYGGTGNDAGNSVQQTSDGGYIVCGKLGIHDFDACLVKTDADGDTLWTRIYGGTSADCGNSVRQTTDGGYIIAGYTYSFGVGTPDSANAYLIKTDALGNVGIEESQTTRSVRPTRFPVQPNPFSSCARVPGHETALFALSDVTGRQVAICKGDRVGEGLRPGIYFLSPVSLRTGKAVTTTIIKAAY